MAMHLIQKIDGDRNCYDLGEEIVAFHGLTEKDVSLLGVYTYAGAHIPDEGSTCGVDPQIATAFVTRFRGEQFPPALLSVARAAGYPVHAFDPAAGAGDERGRIYAPEASFVTKRAFDAMIAERGLVVRPAEQSIEDLRESSRGPLAKSFVAMAVLADIASDDSLEPTTDER